MATSHSWPVRRRPSSIRLPERIAAWLDSESNRRGLSRNDLIILALEQAMNTPAPEDRL